jgi:hypothetical protein
MQKRDAPFAGINRSFGERFRADLGIWIRYQHSKSLLEIIVEGHRFPKGTAGDHTQG